MRNQDQGEIKLGKSPVWENFGQQTTLIGNIVKSGAFGRGCLARFAIRKVPVIFLY